MEIEQKAETHEVNISVVLDFLRRQKKLAPLLRSITPTGEKRLKILKSLSEDLGKIKNDGRDALEFVGFLDAGRFARAFGVRPEKFSKEYSGITFKNILDYGHPVAQDYSIIAANLTYPWPEFNAENEDRAKAFVKELLAHVNSLIEEYGEK
ncbi:MAG: hypothetical protein ACP5MZ_01580 [Candidatus Micrarchaeia archaeon]